MRSVLAATVLALGLGLASSAQAAPLGNAVSGITDGVQTSAVENVGCWWRHGRKYCSGGYYYGGPRYSYGHHRHHRHHHHRKHYGHGYRW